MSKLRSIASVLGMFVLWPAAGQVNGAIIRVDAGRPGRAISPRLWGIFFEEINHAGDGGLYCEMIRNRSFRDADTAEGWSPVGDASVSMVPLSEPFPTTLKVEGTGGVANGGYWGMSLRKGESYRLIVYARTTDQSSVSAKGRILARLIGASGRACAEPAVISGASAPLRRRPTRPALVLSL